MAMQQPSWSHVKARRVIRTTVVETAGHFFTTIGNATYARTSVDVCLRLHVCVCVRYVRGPSLYAHVRLPLCLRMRSNVRLISAGVKCGAIPSG